MISVNSYPILCQPPFFALGKRVAPFPFAVPLPQKKKITNKEALTGLLNLTSLVSACRHQSPSSHVTIKPLGNNCTVRDSHHNSSSSVVNKPPQPAPRREKEAVHRAALLVSNKPCESLNANDAMLRMSNASVLLIENECGKQIVPTLPCRRQKQANI